MQKTYIIPTVLMPYLKGMDKPFLTEEEEDQLKRLPKDKEWSFGTPCYSRRFRCYVVDATCEA